MIRLVPNQSDQIERSGLVTFSFEGKPVQGHAGEMLVSALLRAGYLNLRHAPMDKAPRGAFCCMGLCQECAVRIQGQTVEACRTEVAENLIVERI
ncbi:2Fe-2S iron-sulfur cluster protein [Pacificibacter maritimus]|uniref:2Fe-2S iron-sulfur cluster protein n=1 Tax=Pacificibacter maritimus TaxID=762213 RepID=A0A3N4U6Z1_9RHOB|nr:(2Fe-2S)-binding protein [Pacificibacter maritimus]RPE66523.1 2Fe-2S iron-sulfur cluster protein [Pacificibacter maritimus]